MILKAFSRIPVSMSTISISAAQRSIGICRAALPLMLLAVILLLTLAPILREHSVLIDFFAHFLLQSAIFSLAAGLFLLACRRWIATGLVTVCLIAQASFLQPDLFPASAAHPQPTSISVLFSNVWTGNRQVDAVAEKVRSLDPDVVVLAELNSRTAALVEDLATAYPYSVDCFRHLACDSVVLSRLPVLEDLSDAILDHRVATSAARIAAPFGTVAVAGVHLDRPLPPRRLHRQELQVNGLVALLAEIDSPLLVVGDFNASPWGRLLPSFARDAGLELAWGLEGTWPALAPWPFRIPIDHALTGRGMALLEREVIRLPGSDHLALLLRVGPSSSQPSKM